MRSIRPDSLEKKGTVSRIKKVDRKKKSLEYWIVWLLFLAVFFIFLTIFGKNGLLQVGDLKKVRLLLTEEIWALREENDALRKEIRGLKEDPFFIEKVAREELNLVRPNELVYYFDLSSADTGNK
ncbi:MAG: FtsB family cell division protein [bacterium]